MSNLGRRRLCNKVCFRTIEKQYSSVKPEKEEDAQAENLASFFSQLPFSISGGLKDCIKLLLVKLTVGVRHVDVSDQVEKYIPDHLKG